MAILVSFWSTIFLELWKRSSSEYLYTWGFSGIKVRNHIELVRLNYESGVYQDLNINALLVKATAEKRTLVE